MESSASNENGVISFIGADAVLVSGDIIDVSFWAIVGEFFSDSGEGWSLGDRDDEPCCGLA